MIDTCSKYRRSIATMLAAWMSAIIISGIVFIHKEVTSTGEIVTHIHPYNFTDKTKKHHHKDDAEIQFLNVLFHGTFIESEPFYFETPVFQEYTLLFLTPYREAIASFICQHYYLRGPPPKTA